VEGVLWTRVGLPSFSKPAFSVFLYEYSPAFLRVEVRRKQLVNRLRLNDGGPLGILSAKEIVISSTDLSKDKPAWELLLGKPDTAGAFTAGSGPSVRLVAGSEDHIREILLEVKSIDSARAYLAKQKLIGSASGNVLYLDPVRLQGLRIGLVGR
jgi:hypothetical protein